MTQWVCDSCGRIIAQDEGEPEPRCSNCNGTMYQYSEQHGGKLPPGFRRCDVTPNPFYAGMKTS